jgi:hypothetical protein
MCQNIAYLGTLFAPPGGRSKSSMGRIGSSTWLAILSKQFIFTQNTENKVKFEGNSAFTVSKNYPKTPKIKGFLNHHKNPVFPENSWMIFRPGKGTKGIKIQNFYIVFHIYCWQELHSIYI